MEELILEHLSEGESLHREYLGNLRLRYSILEKSIDGLRGRGIGDIMRMRLPPEERLRCAELYARIRLHEIFFDSFSQNAVIGARRYKTVDRCFGSTSALAYELFCRARDEGEGFLCIYSRANKIEIKRGASSAELLIVGEPALCIDLCEHAYFPDYGFDRERYLRSSLERLNYARLDSSE